MGFPNGPRLGSYDNFVVSCTEYESIFNVWVAVFFFNIFLICMERLN